MGGGRQFESTHILGTDVEALGKAIVAWMAHEGFHSTAEWDAPVRRYLVGAAHGGWVPVYEPRDQLPSLQLPAAPVLSSRLDTWAAHLAGEEGKGLQLELFRAGEPHLSFSVPGLELREGVGPLPSGCTVEEILAALHDPRRPGLLLGDGALDRLCPLFGWDPQAMWADYEEIQADRGPTTTLLLAFRELRPGETPASRRAALAETSFTEDDEARRFVALLVERGALALQGTVPGSLLRDVAALLRNAGSNTAKAERLATLLLKCPAVDELYLDDEGLAGILEIW